MNTPVITQGGGLNSASLFTFDQLASTNSYALDQLSQSSHGTVVLATHQTDGRGRRGKRWLSEAGGSLTFSLILDLPAPAVSLLPLVAGLAVAQALETYGGRLTLKWPNDVLMNGRKIAGVLIESPGAGRYVVGVGINLTLPEHLLDTSGLAWPATSISEQTPAHPEPGEVLQKVLRALESLLPYLLEGSTAPILEQWRLYDELAGKAIELSTPEGVLSGLYTGISQSGELQLDSPDGPRSISSGEIENVRSTGL